MNTTGIQNYLSNVFHPIVAYDTDTSNFTIKLDTSNIDTYSGNIVSVIRADVGDVNSNVYVGLLSGNNILDIKACRNVSAFGHSAGSNISNCSNSVYIGGQAGAGSLDNQDVISIGYQSGEAGAGVSNIFIGSGTRSTLGSRNTFLGHGIDVSNVSDQVRIGRGTVTPIILDTSYNWVGLGGITSPLNLTYSKIDLSGNTRVQGNLGINIVPGDRTLDVNGNFRSRDTSLNTLDFSNGLTRSSGGFASIHSNIPVSPADPATIGTLKRGVILVSAANRANPADYASRMVFAGPALNIVNLGFDVSGGDTTINFATSNIQIVDTINTTTYDYNITYFPLP
jgi:hypothetical protein